MSEYLEQSTLGAFDDSTTNSRTEPSEAACQEAAQRDVTPLCVVCVVTFNSQDSIGGLLRSIAAESIPVRVRILDNASSDRTVGIVDQLSRELGMDVSVEVSTANVGFPIACNRLLVQCVEPTVAVINPDVELTPGALERLVAVAIHEKSAGIVTCRLMTRQGRSQTGPARTRPRLRQLVIRDTTRRLAELTRVRRVDPLLIDRDVECMSGALMVFRHQLIVDVGYLDESVFMYLEDIDFAARVRRFGYRIRYIGTTWAWHDCGGSTPRHASRIYALLPRVWITYIGRYGSPFERIIVRPFIFLLAASVAIKRISARESPAGQIAAMWGAVTYRGEGEFMDVKRRSSTQCKRSPRP